MTETQEMSERETIDWMAMQSFESLADTVILDDMPNHDDDVKRGISAGIWMRACGVVLQDDSDQLYEKFKDDEAADFWLDFAEDLAKFIDSERAGLEIFDACHVRLLACSGRYAKEHAPKN